MNKNCLWIIYRHVRWMVHTHSFSVNTHFQKMPVGKWIYEWFRLFINLLKLTEKKARKIFIKSFFNLTLGASLPGKYFSWTHTSSPDTYNHPYTFTSPACEKNDKLLIFPKKRHNFFSRRGRKFQPAFLLERSFFCTFSRLPRRCIAKIRVMFSGSLSLWAGWKKIV